MNHDLSPQDPVLIRDYDPVWPELFVIEQRAIEERLAAAGLSELVVAIEHAGSTAVPELPAKPVIDLLVGISDLERVQDLIGQLTGLGYDYVTHSEELAERRFFRKEDNGRRTHHLHATVFGGQDWNDHLRFRDVLRANATVRDDYAALKRELATRHGPDRRAYAAAKTEFIREVLRTHPDPTRTHDSD